jgi:hypothetical protein
MFARCLSWDIKVYILHRRRTFHRVGCISSEGQRGLAFLGCRGGFQCPAVGGRWVADEEMFGNRVSYPGRPRAEEKWL